MSSPFADLLALHRTAVLASVDVVNTVGTSDLNRETPCTGWNLGDLLAHMTVQHRGFAAAAHGAGGDLAIWNPDTVRNVVVSDPAGAYADAAQAVLDAFANANPQFSLPELGANFPAEAAVGFHFIDYVVHGWDVAATMGLPYSLPDNLTETALGVAQIVPDGEFRTMANAPFGPVQNGAATNDFERLLRHLGRNPEWKPQADPS
ncbi:TIGR03086 family metal-binding protein [Mycobacterium sp. MAA66]|uniref:TIGR03086 family metal-binding protein n=1 Tax=Mycobacterium sp. MAA66 TaxID=3156297 RepID=UPI00351396A0